MLVLRFRFHAYKNFVFIQTEFMTLFLSLAEETVIEISSSLQPPFNSIPPATPLPTHGLLNDIQFIRYAGSTQLP